MGGDHRGRDRRRGPAAACQGHRQAWPGCLADAPRWRRPRAPRGRRRRARRGSGPSRIGDRRRRRPGLADRGLGGPGDGHVLGIGQAMADQGRFQGHDRRAGKRARRPPRAKHAAAREPGHRQGFVPSGGAYGTAEPRGGYPWDVPVKPMTPAIIRRQVVLEELDVAPDGRFAVVARRSVDRSDRYTSHLWYVPFVRGPRPGAGADRRAGPRRPPPDQPGRAPGRLPPDAPRRRGRRLRPWKSSSCRIEPAEAALSSRRSPPGPWLPRSMASSRSPGPPTASAWPTPRRPAPSGSSIPEPGRRGRDRKAEPDRAPLGRLIRRADWRWDEAGHVDRWEHLFVVGRPAGRAVAPPDPG